MDEDEENEEREVAHRLALIGDKSDDLINGITHMAGVAQRRIRDCSRSVDE